MIIVNSQGNTYRFPLGTDQSVMKSAINKHLGLEGMSAITNKPVNATLPSHTQTKNVQGYVPKIIEGAENLGKGAFPMAFPQEARRIVELQPQERQVLAAQNAFDLASPIGMVAGGKAAGFAKGAKFNTLADAPLAQRLSEAVPQRSSVEPAIPAEKEISLLKSMGIPEAKMPDVIVWDVIRKGVMEAEYYHGQGLLDKAKEAVNMTKNNVQKLLLADGEITEKAVKKNIGLLRGVEKKVKKPSLLKR